MTTDFESCFDILLDESFSSADMSERQREALMMLHDAPTSAVLERSMQLVGAGRIRHERIVGARVLQHLGEHADWPFRATIVTWAEGLLAEETDPAMRWWLASIVFWQTAKDRAAPRSRRREPNAPNDTPPPDIVQTVAEFAGSAGRGLLADRDQIVEILIPFLDSPDAEVRWSALSSMVDELKLTTGDPPRFLSALRRRLEDPDPAIRELAQRGLDEASHRPSA